MNLQNEIDKKANLWIIKENEGLDKQERDELAFWLQNKNHKKSYDENRQIIDECLLLDNDFINEMENDILDEEDFKEKNIFQRSKYLVASIFIACIFAFGTFEFNKYYKATFEENYVSLDKKIVNITLPDESIVDLDIKSQMKIAYYNDRRTVVLTKGKALFSVSKNKEKPFLVKSGNTLIEVLGTKFEVINLNKTTKINVLEGLVRVNHIYNEKGDKKALTQLTKSQSFTLNNLGIVLNYSDIDIKEIASWKNDIIKFDKTTLKTAVNILERYTNQKIEFESYELSQLKISGKFSTLHYKSFLEAIELIYPIKSQKEGDLIKIVKK